MSMPEGVLDAARDSRSSIELTLNSKGETQVKTKIYEGADAKDLSDMEDLATKIHDRLVAKYRVTKPTASGTASAS